LVRLNLVEHIEKIAIADTPSAKAALLIRNSYLLADLVISPFSISPFSMGSSRRVQAAVFSFLAGVMPPMPMLGRSLL